MREISRITGSPSTYFNSILSSAMPGQGEAVAQPGLRAVARHLGQLQLRLETVLRRRIAVAGDRLEALPARRHLLGQLGAAGILLDRAFLCHRGFETPQRINW